MIESEQFCIGLENKPGMLAALCGGLQDAGVNIEAVFVSDEDNLCWVNLVASPVEAAGRALQEKGYNYFTERVLVCRLDDKPGELKRVSSDLAEAGININYVYGGCAGGACTVVLHVDDLPRAVEKLGL